MEIQSPISITDLAEQLGVDAGVVDLAASHYAQRRGEAQTYADDLLPHSMLTVGAAQVIADQVQP